MRGGDRLVNKCNWMSDICSGFLHSTGKSKTFSHRHPSSASLAGSEVPSSLAAFNRGMIAPGNHNFERFAALCNTPGGSQGAVAGAGSIQRSALSHPQMGGCAARVAKLASPTETVKTGGVYHSTKYTPSVSPFGLPAPSEREPRVLRTEELRGRLLVDPYRACA